MKMVKTTKGKIILGTVILMIIIAVGIKISIDMDIKNTIDRYVASEYNHDIIMEVYEEDGLFRDYKISKLLDLAQEAIEKSLSGDTGLCKYSDTELITYAKYCVEEKLKNPKDADFCGIDEFEILKTEGGIRVQGYVDATNDFGAILRTVFRVILTADGEKCEDVIFLE